MKYEPSARLLKIAQIVTNDRQEDVAIIWGENTHGAGQFCKAIMADDFDRGLAGGYYFLDDLERIVEPS